ncbi:MAG TPA: T9SS type A sorting domain-containing protein, partial [Bacteroidales bacterium]|nr:T9SS type A sorting domain-containing protein [Bacteroidales bacterium]
ITGSISLTFDFFMSYYWHVDPNNGADVMLKVSTDGGANWTEIWKEEDYGTFESFTWYTTSVPFDAYAGQSNVKFAFHFLGTDGAETMIDNIKIDFETGSSINDNATNQVSVYPNPSNGLVNVQVSEKSIVTLFDLTGRVIATYQVNGNETISFNQAAAGVYILKVESKNHVSTHKLIVQ